MIGPSTGPDAIIDAGPALTFLARKDTTRILYTGLGLGQLFAPEQVDTEVRRKSNRDPKRFGTVEATWNKVITAKRLHILPDDETPALAAAIHRLERMPMSERMSDQQDLGELLVIAHASVRAEAGERVAILIQERSGTLMAHNEVRRIDRLNNAGKLLVWDTPAVLLRAVHARCPDLPDKTTLKTVYQRMQLLDAALPPISQTRLLTSNVWALFAP